MTVEELRVRLVFLLPTLGQVRAVPVSTEDAQILTALGELIREIHPSQLVRLMVLMDEQASSQPFIPPVDGV